MTHIFSDILIEYLLNRSNETIILGFPDSIHFELEKELTLKDLLESYKAMKDELRKYKKEGEPWFTLEEKEEDGWACMNFFCCETRPGEPPKYCPKCGMADPRRVTGIIKRGHNKYWVPTPDSLKKAVLEEIKK